MGNSVFGTARSIRTSCTEIRRLAYASSWIECFSLHYHRVLALARSYVILQKPEQILAMGKFDRITFDAQIMGGRACIRGMRLPVSVIIGQIAHGATKEEVLADYPDLETADIQQALEYAAWLVREEVVMG